MAERIEILKRFPKGSPISLQFTPVGPVPDLPGLVPSFVDTRLPGFIPHALDELSQPEGFTPSNPLLTYGLPGFPVPSSDGQSLLQIPPSTALPPEPQVLQFHPETGQPLTYLSDGSPVLGPQPPPDQGSASLMGAAVLGTGAMMLPGAPGLGAALLAGSIVAGLTRPAFPATPSRDTKVTDGGVFSYGAAPYQPLDVNVPVRRVGDGGEILSDHPDHSKPIGGVLVQSPNVLIALQIASEIGPTHQLAPCLLPTHRSFLPPPPLEL